MSTASKTTRLTDGPDCRRRGHQHLQLKPFATLTPCRAWGSSPFGVGLAHYDSRLLQRCRSSDIHGTLKATKPRRFRGCSVAVMVWTLPAVVVCQSEGIAPGAAAHARARPPRALSGRCAHPRAPG